MKRLVLVIGLAILACVARANAQGCTSNNATAGVSGGYLQVMPNPTIRVYQSDGVTPAVVYTTVALNVVKAQPFTGDSYGTYSFCAQTGVYVVSITGYNKTVTTSLTIGLTTRPGIDISSQSGSDCGAKFNSGDSAIGTSAGELRIDKSCATTWTTIPAPAANHVMHFVEGGTYTLPAGIVLTRSNQVICDSSAVILKLATATGTLFTFGSGVDASWIQGGIYGCTLQGAGGSSDTSIGVQIGSSTASAHGVRLQSVDISKFGNNVVVSGTGDAFAWSLSYFTLHDAACNGLRIDTTGDIETPTLSHGVIFNNGQNSSTCTGTQVSANSGGHLREVAVHNDNNGNGTIGQFYVPSTGFITLMLESGHFEKTGGVDSTDIQIESTGSNRSSVTGSDNEFTQNPTTALNKPVIDCAQCDVSLTGGTITQKVAASITPAVRVGKGGVGATFRARNVSFICTGTAANCQILNVASGSIGSYDVTGSVMNGYSTATNLLNIAAPGRGCHDLNVGLPGPGLNGSRSCSSFALNNLSDSATAPTISSGFGTSPSISANNGTAAFTVNVGTGGTASSGVIGLPTAANGWNCTCEDTTTFSTTVFLCRQTASSTTTATIGNFSSAAAAAAWAASDTVRVQCRAY